MDEVFTMSKDLISLSILTDEILAKKIEFRNDLLHMTIRPKPTCPILRQFDFYLERIPDMPDAYLS